MVLRRKEGWGINKRAISHPPSGAAHHHQGVFCTPSAELKASSKKEVMQTRMNKLYANSIFGKPALISFCSMLVALVLKTLLMEQPDLFFEGLFPNDPLVYSSVGGVLGFLLIFRTSQAYTRFWDNGCVPFDQMTIEWFDACAQIVSFAETSNAPLCLVDSFQSTTVKMFSLLHLCALHCIAEVSEEHVELIDMLGIDSDRLEYLCAKDVRLRPEIVVQWIQTNLLKAVNMGLITTPPPIVARAFQELNSGMLRLQQMQTVAETPFPIPYSQMALALLIVYTLITPFYAVSVTSARLWTALFGFTAVFIMWTIWTIANSIECPFGEDIDDLDFEFAQRRMNEKLACVMERMTRTPIELKRFVNIGQEASKTRVFIGPLSVMTDRCKTEEKRELRPFTEAEKHEHVNVIAQNAQNALQNTLLKNHVASSFAEVAQSKDTKPKDSPSKYHMAANILDKAAPSKENASPRMKTAAATPVDEIMKGRTETEKSKCDSSTPGNQQDELTLQRRVSNNAGVPSDRDLSRADVQTPPPPPKAGMGASGPSRPQVEVTLSEPPAAAEVRQAPRKQGKSKYEQAKGGKSGETRRSASPAPTRAPSPAPSRPSD